MSKPKRLRDNRMEAEKDERVLPELHHIVPSKVDAHHIVPRRYVPPQCTMCTELRGDDTNDYTRVVSTQRETGLIVRYCKCGFCGNTFKALERFQ
jgi:hypothetical protein